MALDKDKILELYQSGKSMAKIGRLFGVSRQRINQIVKVLYTGNNYRKIHTTINPNKSEMFVAEKLLSLGHTVKFTPKINLYDLLVNNSIRIEVKHRIKSSVATGSFCIPINKNAFDFLIVVVGEIKNNKTYIIPSTNLPQYLMIPSNTAYNTSLHREYVDAWDLIR